MKNFISLLLLSTVLFISSCTNNGTDSSCYDGMQNGNELGIDCGGDCPPCITSSCSDGIQNGNETGIDCGGDCPECTDSISCFDGIQNGDETGIDCGGDCPACPIVFSLNGFAQKGPFITGGSVILFELDSLFQNTGVTYNTNIFANTGEYTFNNAVTLSPYISILVNGKYYDEICNIQSNSTIQLKGIANIHYDTTYNTNVLTHLSHDRILHLVENNYSFEEAKSKARTEILSLFEVENIEETASFDQCNINNNSDMDGFLLAASLIIHGYRSATDFSCFLNDLSNDFKTDGIINDENLGAELLAHAKAIDVNTTQSNLENKYESLGISSNLPDFEYYIENFINNTEFSNNAMIINFPENGSYGINLLEIGTTEYSQANPSVTAPEIYSLHAIIPNDCLTLKVRISEIAAQCMDACWYYSVGSEQNWLISNYNQSTHTQEFESTGESCDIHFIFNGIGTFKIDYFINNAITPAYSKVITVD